MPKTSINPYGHDKFIASLYHFQPQDSFFQANPNVRQKAFDDLNLKGVGKYDGKNWSIRPIGHDLTDKEWNIIHIKLKDGQWGWNEHGILIINKKTKQAYFTSYSNSQQQEVKELQSKGILGKYNLNEKDVQIINPEINPWKGGYDLSYSTSYLTFFIEQLISNLENSNELGDFTNPTYNHKKRASDLHGQFWTNSMNRWNYYQSLVKGTENYKNTINPNQVQEVQEAYQQAQASNMANETKTENQYLEEYNNLPLGAIIEMENYAGWCPTGSHTEINDKTDKELIKLFRIYAVKIWKNEDYQEVKQKLLGKVQNGNGRSHIENEIPRRIKLWRDKREVEGDNWLGGWKWRLRNVEPFYEEMKKNKVNCSSCSNQANKIKELEIKINELAQKNQQLQDENGRLEEKLNSGPKMETKIQQQQKAKL
ncbi:MAG: hypothetical protein MRERV_34c002 [Mycoplasmataceae bacterium RV_VA103A]|nr:MAG: hypothetical protein MRERV_34c002 [Mycoplasmataceae bacterium RV_VA103A]